MKKRIRKGSLLIALSLLLAMMFGMSAYAASEYDLDMSGYASLVEGTTILESGDKIKADVMSNDIVIEIDGVSAGERIETVTQNATPYYVFTVGAEERFILSEKEVRDEGVKFLYTFKLNTYTPEPTPEPAPDNGNNNVNVEDDKEEPKVEEPKETEEQIFTRELLTSVADAKAGDTKEVDATVWHSFNANVLKELLSKEGVSYTFYYNYGGECFYITIPAGAVLEEGCEWYGPLKLNAMFGRTMIDKKDLHAAINE